MAQTGPRSETACCGHVLGPEPLRPRCHPVWFPSKALPPVCWKQQSQGRPSAPLWVCPLPGGAARPRVHLALSTSIPPGRLGSPGARHRGSVSSLPLRCTLQHKPFSRPSPKEPNVPLLCKLISLFPAGPKLQSAPGGREGDGGLNWGAEQLWQETLSPTTTLPKAPTLTLQQHWPPSAPRSEPNTPAEASCVSACHPELMQLFPGGLPRTDKPGCVQKGQKIIALFIFDSSVCLLLCSAFSSCAKEATCWR